MTATERHETHSWGNAGICAVTLDEISPDSLGYFIA
jgi:hypothetical protein